MLGLVAAGRVWWVVGRGRLGQHGSGGLLGRLAGSGSGDRQLVGLLGGSWTFWFVVVAASCVGQLGRGDRLRTCSVSWVGRGHLVVTGVLLLGQLGRRRRTW